jgi:hypothetical protein
MIPMSKLTPVHGSVLVFDNFLQDWCVGYRDEEGSLRLANDDYSPWHDESDFSGWTHIPKLPEVETDPSKLYTYCASGSAHTVHKPMGGELARLVEVNTCINPMPVFEARSFAYAILAVCDAMEEEG